MALTSMLVLVCFASAALTPAQAQAHTDEEIAEALAAARRSNARSSDAYGDQNLRDAAQFMSQRVIDAKHNGDKAAFFTELDVDGNMAISADEMEKVQDHMEAMSTAQPDGLWRVMHNVLKTKSKKGGVHHELMALHDKDGDGAVSHSEFHDL